MPSTVEPVKEQPRKSNFNSRWDKPAESNPENMKDEKESSKQTEGQIPENAQMDYKLPEALTQPEKVEGLPQGESEVLPMLKPEDVTYFSALLQQVDERTLSNDELRDRKIAMLLLKIKNGAPLVRKSALRNLSDRAREFGAGPLFNQILPLLMSPTLED